jgi:hypothetical protein
MQKKISVTVHEHLASSDKMYRCYRVHYLVLKLIQLKGIFGSHIWNKFVDVRHNAIIPNKKCQILLVKQKQITISSLISLENCVAASATPMKIME